MSRAYYCTVEELNERGRENIPGQFKSNMHLIYSSPATLAFNSPGAEGFGVKRAGLAVPGSIMLIVAPGCCGRNTSLISSMREYDNRFFYLMMDETDIVTGRHLKKIPKAVAEICEGLEKKPSVVMICITCVDALLGTDMERVCRKAEEKAGLPVRPCYMYALTREGRKPPMVHVRQSLYSLLEPTKKKGNVVNLLGFFSPLVDDCELYDLLHSAGIKTIHEISRCRDFEEYKTMAEANFNLVLHQESRYAAETVGRMETLLEVEPEIVCCDMHPKYNSVMVAEELGLPVVKVQHHYAHILSCMAENDCAEQVIGVSFDGTGYGTDGTIWGGEILLSDLDGFTRVGSVMPFLQVGGDASSKEGWRIAVSLIYGMTGDRKKAAEITEKLELCTKQEANVQFTMADRKINAVISTSAGRLFDGVSAMLGIRRKSTFEGEASMALEFAAEEYRETMLEKIKQQIQETEKYGYDKEDTDTLSRNENLSETEEIKRMDDKLISAGDRLLLNTESLIKEILNRQLNGEDPGKLAYFFHRELACQITAACVKIRELSGCNKAALSGGVFQNRLLLELTDHMLLEQGFEVLKHQLLPPNDGGIALGQAVYAMAYLEKA